MNRLNSSLLKFFSLFFLIFYRLQQKTISRKQETICSRNIPIEIHWCIFKFVYLISFRIGWIPWESGRWAQAWAVFLSLRQKMRRSNHARSRKFHQQLVQAERGVCLFGYQGEDHGQGESSSKHYARCAIARQVLWWLLRRGQCRLFVSEMQLDEDDGATPPSWRRRSIGLRDDSWLARRVSCCFKSCFPRRGSGCIEFNAGRAADQPTTSLLRAYECACSLRWGHRVIGISSAGRSNVSAARNVSAAIDGNAGRVWSWGLAKSASFHPQCKWWTTRNIWCVSKCSCWYRSCEREASQILTGERVHHLPCVCCAKRSALEARAQRSPHRNRADSDQRLLPLPRFEDSSQDLLDVYAPCCFGANSQIEIPGHLEKLPEFRSVKWVVIGFLARKYFSYCVIRISLIFF